MTCQLEQQFDGSDKSEATPAEFSKILSDGINFVIRKIPKSIKMQENL